MKYTVLTLFPEIIEGYFNTSIMAKAVERELIELQLVNFREFTEDRHRTCDDAPYGGGAGMVLKPEPVVKALDSLEKGSRTRVVYPTPSGRPFTQKKAEELAEYDQLVFICGRYEGLDQRVIDNHVDEELSLGDYVMSSGEIASLVMIDSIYRLQEGVISRESLEEESFSNGLLEYPLYTRPENFRGDIVPDVLLSGHHAEIEKWRLEKRLEKTLRNRPDLLEAKDLTKQEKKLLDAVVHRAKAKNG